jgi:transposase-like protein
MTFTTGDQNILQADARGRVRVSAERREALLDEFERSGLSGAKFARLAGVKYPTFANWAQQRREARKEKGEMDPSARHPVPFVEALIDPSAGEKTSGHGLSIELPGGVRMQVESPTQLRLAAELLRMLLGAGIR